MPADAQCSCAGQRYFTCQGAAMELTPCPQHGDRCGKLLVSTLSTHCSHYDQALKALIADCNERALIEARALVSMTPRRALADIAPGSRRRALRRAQATGTPRKPARARKSAFEKVLQPVTADTATTPGRCSKRLRAQKELPDTAENTPPA